MTTTADTLVPDQLWQAIQALLPTPSPRYGGRPRIDDLAALAGIIYQLRTGVPWRAAAHRSARLRQARSPAGGGCATGSAPGSGSGCRADILGFVHLACALICLKSLDGPKAAPSSA